LSSVFLFARFIIIVVDFWFFSQKN